MCVCGRGGGVRGDVSDEICTTGRGDTGREGGVVVMSAMKYALPVGSGGGGDVSDEICTTGTGRGAGEGG